MRLAKKIMYAAIASMPIFMCGCPEETFPEGYVVKMKKDYSDNVMLIRTYNYNYDSIRYEVKSIDTTYIWPSNKDDIERITGDYYRLLGLYGQDYRNIVCTSVRHDEWSDTLMKSISDYIIDTDPFDEVYAYYEDYGKPALLRIINQNKLKEFEKLK
ncbi:MAG: hypothetical protein IKK68_01335 [Paludibacteraceae bacterium]|nr:hypothetical protein [Paludibacteraceae bacterium]